MAKQVKARKKTQQAAFESAIKTGNWSSIRSAHPRQPKLKGAALKAARARVARIPRDKLGRWKRTASRKRAA